MPQTVTSGAVMHYTPDVKAAVRQRLKAGIPATQISAELDIPVSTIRNWLLAGRTHGEMAADERCDRAPGKTYTGSQLARRLGLT